MCKKILFVLSVFYLVASLPARAELIASWQFEGNANDTSNYGTAANGNLMGGASFDSSGKYGQALKLSDTTQYINCGQPSKLNLSGTFTVMAWVKPTNWGSSWHHVIGKGDTGWALQDNGTAVQFFIVYPTGTWHVSASTVSVATWATDNTWHHVAGTYDGTTLTTYVDGVAGTTTVTSGGIATNATDICIGAAGDYLGQRNTTGLIDDVRIYNNALSAADVVTAMNTQLSTGPNPYASVIYPANGQLEVPVNAVLSWKAGAYAATHNVYFGTSKDDVNAATVTNPKGVWVGQYQSGTTYNPGNLPYATTYYWRVDEVNSPGTAGSPFYKGSVWSFTTDLSGYPIGYADSPLGADRITASASSRLSTTNDPTFTKSLAGLAKGPGAYRDYYVDANHGTVTANNMWLTTPSDPNGRWIQYVFDKEYKLNDMLVWNYNETTPAAAFGYYLSQLGIKDVNIYTTPDYSTTWSSLKQTQLKKATELPTYQATNPINGNDVNMTGVTAIGVKLQALSNWSAGLYSGYGLSEVMFLTAPTYANRYTVTTGNTNTVVATATATVDPNMPNSRVNWKKGRDGTLFASSHKLYIKDIDNDGATNVTPADPNIARNAVRDNTIAALTTTDPNYLLSGLNMQATYYWRVDEVIGAKTWMNNSTRNNYKDIQSFKTVGSRLVTNFEAQSSLIGGGYFVGSPVHGGSVALRFPYNNTSAAVEATVDPVFYNIGQNNWQPGNPTKLVVWFRGDPNNTGSSLYLKLGSTKIVYGANPSEEDTTRLLIPQWTRWNVSLTGVTLSNVTGITYGADKVGSGTATGQLFFDDLTLYRLYPPAPVAQYPGTANLLAYYNFNDNANDMKGFGTAYNGTMVNGAPVYTSSSLATVFGKAVDCNGTQDYVDLGRPAGNPFNPAGDFSISVWVYPTAWATNYAHDIIANRGESPVGWQIRRNTGNNQVLFTTRGTGIEDFASGVTISANTWSHIVCVFDSVNKTKSIYINGALTATGNTTGNKITSTTACKTYIGCRANADTATAGRENYFTGRIDEVRMYTEALNANEVMYLANPAPASVIP